MKRYLSISVLATAVIALAMTSLPAAETNVLKEARVRQIVIDFLQQKTALAGGAIQLKKLGFSGEAVLPAGNVSYEVVSPQEWEGWGRGALALIVRVDDRVIKNIPLNVDVEVLADVVVAARPLERGMVVEKGDVALQKRDMATVPAKVCRNLDEAIGKRVRVEGNPTRREGGTAMSAGVVTFLDEGNKVVCLGGCPGGPPVE